MEARCLDDMTDKELKELFVKLKKYHWTVVDWNVYKMHIVKEMDIRKALWGINDKRYKVVEKIWKTMIDIEEEKGNV